MSHVLGKNLKLFFSNHASAWMALFALFFVVWLYHNPWLFMHYDGNLSYWTSKFLGTWSSPFNLENFNPYRGMGGTFYSMNPWLNPGSWFLILLDNWRSAQITAYVVWWTEVGLSAFFLLRCAGFSSALSGVAAQLFLLLTFPAHSILFLQFPQQSVMPVFAHTIALLNLGAAFFLLIGRQSLGMNICLTFACFLVILIAFFSAPMSFFSFAPFLVVIVAAITILERPYPVFLYRVFCGTLLLTACYFFGMFDYFFLALEGSARTFFETGYEGLSQTTIKEAIQRIPFCEVFTPGSANPGAHYLLAPNCLSKMSAIPQALALVGATITIAIGRGPIRFFGLGYLIYYMFLYCFLLLSQFGILDKPNSSVGHLTFLIHPMMLGVSIMTCVAITQSSSGLVYLFKKFCHILDPKEYVGDKYFLQLMQIRLTHTLNILSLNYSKSDRLLGGILYCCLLVFTLYMSAPYVMRSLNLTTTSQTPDTYPHTSESRSEIIGVLADTIGIDMGDQFLGFAATYFGGPASLVRKEEGLGIHQSSLSNFMPVMDYYTRNYGTRFYGVDLGFHKIPTLEDYSQWTPKALVGLATKSLANTGEYMHPNYIFVSNPRAKILRTLGVRFLISDGPMSDPDFTLVQVERTEDLAPVFLYSLRNFNSGNYSPTKPIVVKSSQEAMDAILSEQFDPENEVIIDFHPAFGKLQKAEFAHFSMVKNGIDIKAKTQSLSALLLPISYTNCWEISSTSTVNSVLEIHRANLAQTLIVFDGEVSLNLRRQLFSWDLSCKESDISDQNRLKFDYFNLNQWRVVD